MIPEEDVNDFLAADGFEDEAINALSNLKLQGEGKKGKPKVSQAL